MKLIKKLSVLVLIFVFFPKMVFSYNDKFVNLSKPNKNISLKSDNEICEMIDIDVSPVITLKHEVEAEKRNLNCETKTNIASQTNI